VHRQPTGIGGAYLRLEGPGVKSALSAEVVDSAPDLDWSRNDAKRSSLTWTAPVNRRVAGSNPAWHESSLRSRFRQSKIMP